MLTDEILNINYYMRADQKVLTLGKKPTRIQRIYILCLVSTGSTQETSEHNKNCCLNVKHQFKQNFNQIIPLIDLINFTYNNKLENLTVLKHSHDLLNSIKIGQDQLQLITKHILFYGGCGHFGQVT